MPLLRLIFSIILSFFLSSLNSQDYFAYGVANHQLYNVNFVNGYCDCDLDVIGVENGGCTGLSFSPEGDLYGVNGNVLLLFDIASGSADVIMNLPLWFEALVSIGNGVFYAMHHTEDEFYRINLNDGSTTLMGSTGYDSYGDLALYNGELYYSALNGIVKVDTNILSNSFIIVPIIPDGSFRGGLTASSFCNSLLAIATYNGSHAEIISISLIDGVITKHCTIPDYWFVGFASMLEFAENDDCDVYIDLDCNDSSGATEADYNSLQFDCLSDGVGVADEDIVLHYDAIITEMTIQVTGFIPDAPFEIVDITGSVPNIGVAGAGTDFLTLTNEGGATSRDFKDALRLVVYKNIAPNPTGGLRTVEVQFTTESGAMSNIATAFIQVNELFPIIVDLGDDVEICEGGSATFDAGYPGSTYQWSSGHTTQMITVSSEGQYIVSVSNDNGCVGIDTVLLDLVPTIHVSLQGVSETCDNVPAQLTLVSDSPFPLDVEIGVEPGSSIYLSGISGTYSFNHLQTENTAYTILEIIPSQPACIEIGNLSHQISVLPSYIFEVEESICEGDSIFLGFSWETQSGIYENTLSSLHGCDSVVTTILAVLPAEQIFQQTTTCDPAEVGVVITHLNNPNGCDTVIHTTVTLLESDTTLFFQTTCNQSASGVFQSTLTNILGCDSVVITTISLVPDPDTTVEIQMTCDSSLLGSMPIVFTGIDGCDSVVVIHVEYPDALVMHESASSCDPSEVGIVSDTLMSSAGCDSIVITTTSLVTSYMISVMSLTCDEASAGIFIDTLQSSEGCDSIVTETILFAGIPRTDLFSTTCDPSSSGIFIDTLVSQYGCDSIVTLTVDLLPSSDTQLTGTTCTSSEAGVFITTHLNQYGCDSTVTLTVSLVPADTTTLESFTCDPAMTGSTEDLFTNSDGCDSLVISTITLYPLPQLDLVVTSDYNGYSISCYGERDGSASANVNGSSPWTYLWSTSDMTQNITGLSAGNYAVTVTDGNGCTAVDNVVLNEPPPFDIMLEITHPDCFDGNKGEIRIQQIGGIEPIRYSIDGINYQTDHVFDNLTGGTYQVSAIDANDCQVNHILWINVPLMVNVELGDNQILFPGDTAIIQAVVNVPYDSLSAITWTGLINTNCPTCLTQAVAPVITTTYSVSVTSHDGCMDEDAITLFLEQSNDIYVPNVFSPNGDNNNDVLLISAAPQVERIASFHLYDRWGDMVFSKDDFIPNDPQHAWDGISRGKPVNPGVFVYRMILEVDGKKEVRYGDVTVVR